MTEIKTLHHLINSQIDKWKSYPAVVFDDGENKITISYSQMTNLSKKVSDCLSSHLLQNEVVGICMPPNVHTPTVLLGILECGASFYNFESTSISYVRHVIEEVGIRCLIMDKINIQNFKDLISEFGGEIIPEPVLEGTQASLILLRNKKIRKQHGSLAYCITTSGTTGLPKIVQVPHSCVLPNILDLRKIFCVTTSDVIFLSSPLTFDPSIVDIFVALSSGACLLIVPHVIKMMPNLLLDMLYKRHNVTIIQATPTLISRLDNSVLSQTLLSETSKLRVLALGGEKFPPLQVLQQWRSVNNKTRIFNLYGTTEVSCWVTCYELLPEDFSQIDREIPLGSPLTHTQVVVMDTEGKPVHKGQGKLFIESLQRRCYLDNEELADNDETSVSRGTGDTVQVLDNGDVVYLYRTDDQVKRNGQRINLREIKMVMLKLPYITNCEVLYQNGKLAIFVTIEEQDNKELPSDRTVTMETHLRNSLPSHYWPDYLQYVKVFPMTRHGKLDKDALWKIVFSRKCNILENQRNVCDILKKKWEEILSIPSNTIDSTARFLMCGGDSFSAVTLSDQIELTLGLTLPQLLDLILHKTFRDICSYIEEEIRPRKTNEGSESVDFNTKKKTSTNFENSVCETKTGYVIRGNDRIIDLMPKTSKTNYVTPVDNLVYKNKSANNYIEDHDNWTSHLEDDNMSTGGLNRKRRQNITDCTNIEDFDTSNYKNMKINKYEKNNLVVELSVSRGNRIRKVCNYKCGEVKQTVGISDGYYMYEKQNDEFDIINSTSEDTTDGRLCIDVTEAWKYNTGKCVDASPLVVRFSNGLHTVYIGSHSYEFSAVTMETGHVQWEVLLGDRIESSACLSMHGAYIVVGCYDGAVYCLNTTNGDVWWEFQTEGEVKSSPVLDINTGLVIFGSHDQHVYALNVEDKRCVWKSNLSEGSVFSSPCVGNSPHHVYVCTLSGCVAALDPFTGSILWYYKCSKPIFSSPVVTCGGVCVGCVSGQLLLLDFEGKLKWNYHTGGPIFSSPVSVEIKTKLLKNNSESTNRKLVIVGSHDGHIYAITSNGELLWKLKCESAVYSTIFDFCLGVDRNQPECLELCNDEKKTSIHDFPGDGFSRISTKKKRYNGVSDNKEKKSITDNSNDEESKIFKFENMNDQKLCVDQGRKLCLDYCNICVAASINGVLYLIDIEKGDLLHKYRLPGEVFSSPVVVNDHVIVGCRDDFVYCLKINYNKNN